MGAAHAADHLTARGERRDTVDALLRQTNLHQVRKVRLGAYSGGMKQRFGIAQALLGHPQLLIMDEPTAGLDPTERNRFLNLLASIGDEVIVILSTHIVADVAELCSRMAIIDKGQVLMGGQPQEAVTAISGTVWKKIVARHELADYQGRYDVLSTHLSAGRTEIRVVHAEAPGDGFAPADATLEDLYFATLGRVRMYLRHELDRYLSRRSDDKQGELPLFKASAGYALVNKGTIAMYALRDAVGEATVNAALRRYLEHTRFQNPPYTHSLELLAYLKAAVPESERGLIEDLFERIILYDNRALEATYVEKPDGRFVVSLKVSVRKLQADEVGRERQVGVNDLIDAGVFAGSGLTQRPLYLEKRRLTHGETTFEIEVGERPTTAGIDPYNKLVDRRSDDNSITVTKR